MKIYYMTWLRNRIGLAEEVIEIPEKVKTISDLLTHMENKGDLYKQSFKERTLIYATKENKLCDHSENIYEHDELTLFSPIVGG